MTPTGPLPSALTIPAGMYPVWINNDRVAHTVSFANGLCSFQVAPGDYGQCGIGFQVGRYPYAVDGTAQASVVVGALPPDTVTLTAKHTIRLGAHVGLHGTLGVHWCCLPAVFVRTSIIVLARHDRHHPFDRIATVHVRENSSSDGGVPWRLRLRPTNTTIFIAKRNYQPEGEQGWQTSWSRPFKVAVRR